MVDELRAALGLEVCFRDPGGAIAGVTIAAADPAGLGARWAGLGIDEAVAFVAAASEAVDGITAVELRAVDRARVGERHRVCGVDLVLV